jgi:hypothetical protein
MECFKGLVSNVHGTDVRQKIENFSWKELSGHQTLNVYSSTIDWLQLAEMSLGYWYSMVQECNICKKTVKLEKPNWRYLLPLDDIHNHTIDDVASLIDGRLPLHYRLLHKESYQLDEHHVFG